MEKKIKCNVLIQMDLSKDDLVYSTQKDFKVVIKRLLGKISKPNFDVLDVNPMGITKDKLAKIRNTLLEIKMKDEEKGRDVIVDLGSITMTIPNDLDENLIRNYCYDHLDDEEIKLDQVLDANTGDVLRVK